MTPTTIGNARLYQGDCREVLASLAFDELVTDPVWPNCPPGLLTGADRPAGHWLRMYGPIWTEEDEPKPQPEKSPVDKAIDEMMAKRKAKRDSATADNEAEATNDRWKVSKEDRDGRALSDAMNKLAPHDVAIHERLMPYRGGPVL